MMPVIGVSAAKDLFFDVNAILEPARKAKVKLLSHFGNYTKKIAKNMIKTGAPDQHSKPGEVPIGHDGKTRYKDFIYSFVDKETDEVLIGGILLAAKKDRTIMPGVLEHGGEVDVPARTYKHGGKVKGTGVVFTQQARPHMVKAFDIAVKKFLPELLENCIIKEAS